MTVHGIFFQVTFTLFSQIHNYGFHFRIIYSAYCISLLLDIERYFCKDKKPSIQQRQGTTPSNLGSGPVCFAPHKT